MGKAELKSKMQQRLQKPTFCNINEIKAGRHCYNVYCQVVKLNCSEITKFNGEVIRIADGVVGDDTGVANFRLVGDNVDKVKEEMVIAIRNGRLEVDKFGLITEEKDKSFERIKKDENVSSYAYV